MLTSYEPVWKVLVDLIDYAIPIRCTNQPSEMAKSDKVIDLKL